MAFGGPMNWSTNQRYIENFQLPVRTGVADVSVEQSEDEGHFIVKTKTNGQREEFVSCRSVVIASSSQQTSKFPATRSRLPNDIVQLHTADYHNAAALPPGAIVVVGSGKSGCQITEDFLSASRTVFLCTSKVGRAPRRYRGRDILGWWIDMKFLDVTFASLEDKAISRTPQPQVSGLGRYGHSVSPLRRLNLREAKVRTVIWATGFTSDFDWIHLPVLDAESRPIYQRGISPVRDLYFIGFPWLSSRKSGIIYGIDEDAHYIADANSEQFT